MWSWVGRCGMSSKIGSKYQIYFVFQLHEIIVLSWKLGVCAWIMLCYAQKQQTAAGFQQLLWTCGQKSEQKSCSKSNRPLESFHVSFLLKYWGCRPATIWIWSLINKHTEREREREEIEGEDISQTGNRRGLSAYLTSLRHQGNLQTPADVWHHFLFPRGIFRMFGRQCCD